MKKYILATFGLLVYINSGNAESGSNSEEAFINLLKARLPLISTLGVTAKLFEKDSDTPSITLIWKENVASYGFELHEVDGNGNTIFSASESSGPTGSMKAIMGGDYINAKSDQSEIPMMVRNFQLPTSQFEFVFNRLGRKVARAPGDMFEIKDEVWTSLADSITLQGSEVFEGVDCQVFKVEGGIDRFLDVPIYYKVFVPLNSPLLPIGWEAFVENTDQLVSRFQIISFDSPAEGWGGLPLPVEAKVEYFATSLENIRDSPTNWQRFSYSNYEAVSPRENLTVDLTAASRIHDVDSDVVIPVPR